MRTRTTWCITLFLLCHPTLHATGVTKQLPPVPLSFLRQAAAKNTPPQQAVPARQKPTPQPAEDPDAMGVTPLTPAVDPAFAPPPSAAPAPQVTTQDIETEIDEPPAPPPPISMAADIVDTGIAVPIEAPPPGTPVHIEATKQGKTGDVYTLDGDILILYKTYRIRADHAVYNTATSIVEARGHVTVDGGPSDEHLVSDHGTMNLDTHTAHFYDVTGTLGVRSVTHDRFVFTAPNPFALTGREVLELGPGRYQVLQGTMTSCRLPDPDWRMLAKSILIDNNVARARNSTFTLFHVPLFFLPYVSHPIQQNHRQSGLLLPVIGDDTTKGVIVGDAAYLVLGRSADATIGSEYFSACGFAPFGQARVRGFGEDFASFRFRSLLEPSTEKSCNGQPGTNNQGGVDIFFDGRRIIDDHTRAVADVEFLSSYVYRQAFEENYTAAINSEVKSSIYITRETNGLSASGIFERYQNFRSDVSGDEIRVLHTPELHLDALDRPIPHLPLLWGGEATASALSRSEPGFQTSRLLPRLDLYPHLALPLSADGWHLRAQAGVRNTFYGKSQEPGQPGNVPAAELGQSLNRKAFIGDVTLHPPTMERDFMAPFAARFFHTTAFRHTIEPELSYHYVTGVNHFADTLRFDTTDVLTDTNELEYGLTQRLFLRHLHPQPCKGDEALGPNKTCGERTVDWLTWTVAQRYYFNPSFGGAVVPGQRNVFTSTLDLTGVAFLTSNRSSSPVISRLRLRTTSATDLEWDVDYDVHSGRMQASNLFASYRRDRYFFSVGDSRLVNVIPQVSALPNAPNPNTTSTESTFNQLHLAAIYGSPTKHGFSAGGNIGYDFIQTQTQYLGAQGGYNRDCCGLSVEVRRYSLGAVRDDTQYLFSFTLAGVGSAGSLSPALRVF